ncbi:biotin/acetyl-CoA-carboxylase ligase [Spirochaeta thermophila DSM 6578]|uniref:Biotin/acetyl-CoA-carboxylase ligase n=1 Tax=Winmispira thermophila (strain ATCC 700085 / DSM 6578 / Z-1203) TaxID=869211 RepID=G0GEG9_WINT7|nr:biotin--[acetyl-CoA-carboxylase] ligase [Spirochaeta thermophila]AEJ62306.1 biotin/acetyl-CoA-carboxylase ligase [Spirochaeta thermophila DSM 6578]
MLPIERTSPFHGSPIFHKDETTSTMVDAKNLYLQSLPSGTVVWADHQVSGRGRVPGRRWVSEPGENLLFTFFLRKEEAPEPFTSLPVRVGFGVARYLEDVWDLPARVKWPNDVLVRGRKICGILCEVKYEAVFVGIGLNVNQRSFPGELSRRATSIRRERHRRADLEEVLLGVLSEVKAALGDEEWREGVERRLWRRGEEVVFLEGDPDRGVRVCGVVEGVGGAGELLLRTDEGMKACVSGEVEWG